MFDYTGLKNYLEENGYKQKFIAAKLDITESALSAILNGKIKCSLETYVNFCRVLEIPFGKFIKDKKS